MPQAGAVPGPDAQTATAYQGVDDGVNHILSPHGIDPSQQDNAYGGAYPPPGPNEGPDGY